VHAACQPYRELPKPGLAIRSKQLSVPTQINGYRGAKRIQRVHEIVSSEFYGANIWVPFDRRLSQSYQVPQQPKAFPYNAPLRCALFGNYYCASEIKIIRADQERNNALPFGRS